MLIVWQPEQSAGDGCGAQYQNVSAIMPAVTNLVNTFILG
jgi:hypothetical protein